MNIYQIETFNKGKQETVAITADKVWTDAKVSELVKTVEEVYVTVWVDGKMTTIEIFENEEEEVAEEIVVEVPAIQTTVKEIDGKIEVAVKANGVTKTRKAKKEATHIVLASEKGQAKFTPFSFSASLNGAKAIEREWKHVYDVQTIAVADYLVNEIK